MRKRCSWKALASLLRGIVHPDATGTIAERQTLSSQRAEAVRSMFLLAGVSQVLVTASGNANSKYLDGRVEVVIHPLISG
jgi:hypothetical protein